MPGMRAVSILDAVLAVLALSALLAGCARPAPDEDSPAAGWHVEQADAAGGATLAVRLDRSRITTAEWVLLEVEVAAAEGRVVQFPAAAALQKGSLRVERTQTLQPELLDSGLVRWVRRFELQPFLAGDYAVPGLTIAVADAAGGETRLRSEPIPVTVVSVLDPAETTPRPRAVAAPVAVAPRPGHVALLGSTALAAAVGAVALIVVLRRRAARECATAARSLLPTRRRSARCAIWRAATCRSATCSPFTMPWRRWSAPSWNCASACVRRSAPPRS